MTTQNPDDPFHMEHSKKNTAPITKTTANATWFFLLFFMAYGTITLYYYHHHHYYYYREPNATKPQGWPALYMTLFLAVLGVSAVALLVVALRATFVMWITVLVLLAFAGKRRRSLVREGRKITADVSVYVMKTVLKDRSIITFALAILSFTALMRRGDPAD